MTLVMLKKKNEGKSLYLLGYEYYKLLLTISTNLLVIHFCEINLWVMIISDIAYID